MLPKSLHTVRVLTTLARFIELSGGHFGAQAVHAAAASLGYVYTAAEGDSDPVLLAAIRQHTGAAKPRSVRA